MKEKYEKYYHAFFRMGVWLKTAATFAEIALGAILYLVPLNYINGALLALIGDELTEAPRDLIWRWAHLGPGFQGISPATQSLWAFLLLGHGLVKVFLVLGLLKEKLWAYPASAFIFGLFVIYQIYQSWLVPSVFLNALTTFDIILIFLILHEYRYRLAARKSEAR